MAKITMIVAALVGAAVLLAGPAGAQETQALTVTSVDPAGYPEVTAVVTAGAGHRPEAFEVLEDGKPVPFTVEPVASGSLEIMLVIDTSGSMVGAPIEAARAAVSGFLGSLPPDVRVGIVAFSSQPALLAAPTTDRGHLTAQVAALAARGETALNDAVVFATSQFTASATDRAVIVLSDGGDTASAASLDQAVTSVAGSRVHVIELVSDESNRTALDRLAAAGGGGVLSSSDPAALGALYRDAGRAVLGEYRISYQSKGHGSTSLTVRLTTPEGVHAADARAELPAAPQPPTTGPTTDRHADPGGLPAEQIALIVGAGAFFVALALVVLVGLSTDRRRPAAQTRLGVSRPVATASGVSHLADRMTAAAEGMLDRRNQRRNLATALEVAGISLRPGEVIVLCGLATFVAGLGGLALLGVLGLAAAVVLVPLAARAVVGHLADRRRTKFAEQLPDTLQLLTSTLRSGYGLLQALDSVAQEAPEPARTEFRRALLEVRVGRDPSTALHAVADRMGSQDFSWVVGAIDINREIGGDLVSVLETTAETIRERQKVFRQMRALTAEGRLSSKILTALPIVVAGAMWFINPESMSRLTSGLGLMMAVAGGFFLLMGWLWIKRLVRIEY